MFWNKLFTHQRWRLPDESASMRVPNSHRRDIRKLIIYIARQYIGQEEIKGNMGFKSTTFYKKMVSVGFKKTHPWCAYFAELVWKEAYRKANLNKFKELDALFSGSVLVTLRNFLKAGYKLNSMPAPGDLVIWQKGKTSSGHIGIVVDIMNNGKYISTVEGNTDDGGGREGIKVALKKRENIIKYSNGLHILGYISPI